MKNLPPSNVRPVLCPRCREVLLEPTEVPFYRCGGCGTTLQAKYYRKANERRETVSDGSGSVQNLQTNEVEQQCAHSGEASSSSAQLISSVQCSSGQNEGIEQPAQLTPENGEVRQDDIFVEEQLQAADSGSEAASSQATAAKTEKKALSNGEADELNQNISTNCRLEEHERASFLSETLLSNEAGLHKINNSSQVVAEEGNVEGSSTKVEGEQLGVSNFSKVPLLSNEPQVVDKFQNEIIWPAGGISRKIDEPVLVVPKAQKTSGLNPPFNAEVSTAPDDYRNGETHRSVEADPPAYGNNRIPASPASETVMEAEIVNLANRSQKTVGTNLRGKDKELQKTTLDEFEGAASSKATETAEVVDAHLEAGTSYRNLPKFPSRNSFAYDGSVSSFDANDDQVADQGMQWTNKAENPVAEQGTPLMLKEIKVPEIPRHSHRRNTMRPRTEEFPSRVPPFRRFAGMPYESSSHFIHEELYDHPIHYPPYRYRDIESRVTRRQLHRSDVDGRMFSEAFWMGEELHMHPYHESSGEIYRYPRHQMHRRGGRQREYQPLVHSIAHIPYMREMGRDQYRVYDSYSHLHPRDMWWSSQFARPGVPYSRGWYIPREPFASYTASPQVFPDSEYYAWSHDSISEDQRQRNQRTSRLKLRRNSQPVQHFQPIGGAAPFITCYRCLELLQLPSDFLLLNGVRIHRVKCSACLNILKFALEKGCHLVPCVSKPMAPPRDDEEKCDFNKSLKSASKSQANHDYEALHRKSVSASVYAGNSQVQNAEKVSLHSSSEAPERRKNKVEGKHTQDKGKSKMVEIHNSAAATSSDVPRHKVTWVLPARSSSPLHRLMGYSSPGAVLGSGSGDSETQE